MANLLVALILITVIILFIGATADVRFTYTDSLTVNIDFLFFTLILSNRKDKTRRSGEEKSPFFQKIKESLQKTKAKRDALAFLLKNSAITVHDINIPLKNKEPSKTSTDSANISALILLIFTYLSLKVQSLTLQDESFFLLSESKDEKIPTLDFTVRTTVYGILYSSLIYFMKGLRKCRKQK